MASQLGEHQQENGATHRLPPSNFFSIEHVAGLASAAVAPLTNPSDLFRSGLIVSSLAVAIPTIAGLATLWAKRRLRRERAPVKTRLLRPPAYSLNKRADDLWDSLENQLFLSFTVLMLFAAFVPAGWHLLVWMSANHIPLSFLRNQDRTSLMIVCLTSLPALPLFGYWTARRILSSWTKIHHYRFGAKGELAVAQALQSPPLVRAGYTSFHDLPMDYGNIDHICAGPGGIYVIETKTRSKRKSLNNQAEHEVVFDGRTLRFPWGDDDKAVRQVLANVDWLRKQLAEFTPRELPIKPVIVVPGWWCSPKGKYPVVVCSHTYLDYIAKEKPQLDPEQIQLVAKVLDERCRTVEF